ncbi:MAG: glycosyltransferase, partial [Actinomycetota bacterium]|nr:glycosyltransferase [Actinomycetota bacterium]
SHSDRPRTGPISLGSFADHDLVRLLLAADVIVNPVEAGSGTNLKLIEALASGTPVVATAVGARGLPDPDSVLRLAEPDNLSAGIRAVLAAPEAARERAVAGQRLANQYRWDVALGPLESAIADLLGVPLAP